MQKKEKVAKPYQEPLDDEHEVVARVELRAEGLEQRLQSLDVLGVGRLDGGDELPFQVSHRRFLGGNYIAFFGSDLPPKNTSVSNPEIL